MSSTYTEGSLKVKPPSLSLIESLIFRIKEYNILNWNLRAKFRHKHSKTSIFYSWNIMSRRRFLFSLPFSFRNGEDWPRDSQIQHPRIHRVPLQGPVQPDCPSQGSLEADERVHSGPHSRRAGGVQLRGLPTDPLTYVVRHRPLALRSLGFR